MGHNYVQRDVSNQHEEKNSMMAFWVSNGDSITSVRIPKNYVAEISAVLENCFKRAEKQVLKCKNKPGVNKKLKH